MATAKKAAAVDWPPLEQIPITHHTVTCALEKAEAALDLLKLAEEHYEGDSLDWMRGICVDVIAEEIERAKAAYVKAASDQTPPATEAAR